MSSTFTSPPSSVSSATTTTSTSTLPPISSLQTSPPIHSSSSNLPPFSFSTTTLPLHPHNAVATSTHLQQYSAVRQLTDDLQQRKPRHPKSPQLPPGEAGTPVRRIVHTAIYKQKLQQYNNILKLYENYIFELLKQTTAELDKIIDVDSNESKTTNVNSVVNKLKPPHVSKLHHFKSSCIILLLSPLHIQIPSHNCSNCPNYLHCYPHHCSHLPYNYSATSQFPRVPSSRALIPNNPLMLNLLHDPTAPIVLVH